MKYYPIQNVPQDTTVTPFLFKHYFENDINYNVEALTMFAK